MQYPSGERPHQGAACPLTCCACRCLETSPHLLPGFEGFQLFFQPACSIFRGSATDPPGRSRPVKQTHRVQIAASSASETSSSRCLPTSSIFLPPLSSFPYSQITTTLAYELAWFVRTTVELESVSAFVLDVSVSEVKTIDGVLVWG